MSDRIVKQAPLWYAGTRPGASIAPAHAIRCFENGLQAHVNLRGDAGDASFVKGAERALGVALPLAANTTSIAQDTAVYWLGPDEWLVVAPGEREREIVHALRTILDGVHSSVTAVTGGQTILVLRGTHVWDLLAKGCPFDLRSPAFGLGACAQTHLAKAGVLLRPLGEHEIEIVVRRSFADYLYKWLETAAGEYGWVHESEKSPARRASRTVAQDAATPR